MGVLERISRALVCFICPIFLFYLVPRILFFSEQILKSIGQFQVTPSSKYVLGWLLLFYFAKLSHKLMVIEMPQFETETRILGISATYILATCIMGLILMTLLFLNALA